QVLAAGQPGSRCAARRPAGLAARVQRAWSANAKQYAAHSRPDRRGTQSAQSPSTERGPHQMTTPIVALAVSGHGFGHAVRCAEVARVLIDEFGVRTLVRTDAPAWLFPARA